MVLFTETEWYKVTGHCDIITIYNFFIEFAMLDFVYVTPFKCLCDIILLHFLYIRPVHIFVVHRKGQVTGVTSVVPNLVFTVMTLFFVLSILELAYQGIS